MIYLKTLGVAMEDGIVTDDEMSILNILANCLGLRGGVQKYANSIIDGAEISPITSAQEEEWSCRHIGDATCYQSALIAALDDEVITDDEMSMLDCLRRAMGLQPDEHALVEEAVRVMIENYGDERLMVRLESYLTSNPST
jgi:tellurite resistance protein